MKYIWFNGLKYTRDEKTDYYLNSTFRERLHRATWEYHNGKIPKGYHVHHKDGNKLNNDISNLEILPGAEHISLHGNNWAKSHYEKMVKNMEENVRPKAIEWHGSADGHKWHKEQYKIGLKKFKENKVIKKCKQCEKEFKSLDTKIAKFCSNNCKSKHRRESGVDDITRVCKHCGNDFVTNKYSKIVYCSRRCMKKEYWKNHS